MRIVDVRRVGFEYRNACISHVEVRRVRFDYRKAFTKPVEVRRVGFDYRKACGRVDIDYLKASRRPV